jgi:hypothetical protein
MMTRYRIVPTNPWLSVSTTFKLQKKFWFGWRTLSVEESLERAKVIIMALREFEIEESKTSKLKENE